MNRRAPLRRTSVLQSRAVLKPGRPLARTALQRRSRDRQETARRVPRPDTGFSAAVKLAVRRRAGGGDPDQARCEACPAFLGRHGGQVQHRLARRAGGSRANPEVSAIENAVLLCGTPFEGDHGRCERREREMGPDGAGFWLRSGQHPAAESILLATSDGGIRAWLTPSGGYSEHPPAGAA